MQETPIKLCGSLKPNNKTKENRREPSLEKGVHWEGEGCTRLMVDKKDLATFYTYIKIVKKKKKN